MAVAGQIYSTTPIRLTRKCITVRGIDSVWKATKTPRNAVINLRLNYRASQVKRLKESSRMWSRCSESEHNLRTTPRLQVLCFWFTPSSSLDKKPAGICAWCLHEASTALTHSLGSRGCSNKASLTWVAHVKKKKNPCSFMLKLSSLGRVERGFPCAAYLEPPGVLLDAQNSQVPPNLTLRSYTMMNTAVGSGKKQAGMSRSWHWCHGGHVRPLWTLQAAFNHHA